MFYDVIFSLMYLNFSPEVDFFEAMENNIEEVINRAKTLVVAVSIQGVNIKGKDFNVGKEERDALLEALAKAIDEK